MNKSESIANLAASLSAAQAEMPAVPMNAVNPFLKNKYADLGAVIQTARPILAKHGLSVSQMVGGNDNRVSVTTILMHSSGEWLENTVDMQVGDEKGKSAAQVAGSIITYLRRYSLAAALGMYADEDADGNQPAPKAPQKAQPAPQEMPSVTPDELTLEQAAELVNSQGMRYGDIDTEKLSFIANNAKTPPLKKRAAALIIDARRADSESSETPDAEEARAE
jgi:hypothetical protein